MIPERHTSLYTRRAGFNYCAFSVILFFSFPPSACDLGACAPVDRGAVSVWGAEPHAGRSSGTSEYGI